MFDLNGKSSDAGTIEEWWASPGRAKTVVTAGSLKSTDPMPLDKATPVDPRERYFVRELLAAEVHPLRVPAAASALLKATENDKTFAGVTLTCFALGPEQQLGAGRQALNYCADPKTNALRAHLEGTVSTTVRNQIGTFHGTSVGLEIEIAYSGHPAITGKVTALLTFDPSKSDIELSIVQLPPTSSEEHSSWVVEPGKILSKVPPEYPVFAKASHIQGTVVLHAVISKQGTTKDIFALASPNEALTGAAINAVKLWKYSPYLLDGKPTDVETVINVNFLLGGR